MKTYNKNNVNFVEFDYYHLGTTDEIPCMDLIDSFQQLPAILRKFIDDSKLVEQLKYKICGFIDPKNEISIFKEDNTDNGWEDFTAVSIFLNLASMGDYKGENRKSWNQYYSLSPVLYICSNRENQGEREGETYIKFEDIKQMIDFVRNDEDSKFCLGELIKVLTEMFGEDLSEKHSLKKFNIR